MALLLTALLLSPQPCADGLHPFEGRCLTADEYYAWPPAPVLPVAVALTPSLPSQPAGVERWRSMVAYYWPAAHVDRMLAILACESRGDPDAWNRSTDVRGLFQVRYPLWSKLWPGNYFDPWTNAAIAYQVWREQGYRAWACKG